MKSLNVYCDTEFTGLHQTTTLISIGAVIDPEVYFYGEFIDYAADQVDEWVEQNVISNLTYGGKYHYATISEDAGLYDVNMSSNTGEVQHRFQIWLEKCMSVLGYDTVTFVLDTYAYDWVLISKLMRFGRFATGWRDPFQSWINYIPVDISTMLYCAGIDPDISREGYVGDDVLNDLVARSPFRAMKLERLKHNSLWDAFVIKYVYEKLRPTFNGIK